MYRLITLGAAMLAGAVQAATVPSDLMLPVPERAARRACLASSLASFAASLDCSSSQRW